MKSRLKAVIPSLFALFPSAHTAVANEVASKLAPEEKWTYREQTRLPPGRGEFPDLHSFLTNLKSPLGLRRASGSVSRYLSLSDLDAAGLNLEYEFAEAVRKFLPLMRAVSGQYKYGNDYVAMTDLLAESGANETAEQLGAFDPTDVQDGRRKILTSITRRQGQGAFRLALLSAYGGKCAITGTQTLQTLEAAHIFPHKGLKTNAVSNGILLRADLHTLFDLGLFHITDQFEVVVSDDVADKTYRDLHGKKLILPSNVEERPSREALRWHRNNVKFL